MVDEAFKNQSLFSADNMNKTVWIDLDNSPHVPLFIPIIRELESRNCRVIITARDFAQTVELLHKTTLKFKVIGSHYGKNKINKVLGLFIRAYQLAAYIRKNKVSVAMNHGSRSQTLASWFLGIPVFCGLDYEHTESYIFSKLASRMWIPEGVSDEGLRAIGVKADKLIRYKGYKEEVYLSDFIPENDFRKKIGIDQNQILVTLRPPATLANYHNEQSERFLVEIIRLLKKKPSVYTICLPRTNAQGIELQKHTSEKFIIPKEVMDGMNLAYHSDLVISGGGTMNREAALLGTPVYSIFSGKLGSLDAFMEANGLIRFVHGVSDIATIKLEKKGISTDRAINSGLVKFLSNELLRLAVR